jgi:hypothetical protein
MRAGDYGFAADPPAKTGIRERYFFRKGLPGCAGEIVIVPNGALAKAVVANHHRPSRMHAMRSKSNWFSRVSSTQSANRSRFPLTSRRRGPRPAILASLLLTACVAGPANRLPAPETATLRGQTAKTLIEADFIAYDPSYKAQEARLGGRLFNLAADLARLQAGGNDMKCSNQIYLEANWLYHYTTDWPRLVRQLDLLADSLSHPDQAFARYQESGSGGWGMCYDEWFLQLEATFDLLEGHYDRSRLPRFLVEPSQRLDTPEKLRAYLNSLLVSDIAATGRNNRAELGDVTTLLSSAFFKDYLQAYLRRAVDGGRGSHDEGEAVDNSFSSVYEDFLQRWQDPQTGYWGAWYRSGSRVYRTADLSITYHTIAYRRGRVDFWPRIIATTLAIRDEPYPYGWLHDGHYTNHNNYDVVRILQYGWPYMTGVQRRQAAAEIGDMLAWSLRDSLDAEGNFKSDPSFFSSVAADFYFGVSFLDRAGFWDREKRFWTSADFPEAPKVCRLIRSRLLRLGLHDPQARRALGLLKGYCGD